jgi:hypothetical protein
MDNSSSENLDNQPKASTEFETFNFRYSVATELLGTPLLIKDIIESGIYVGNPAAYSAVFKLRASLSVLCSLISVL